MVKLRNISTLKVSFLHIVNSRNTNSLIDPLPNSPTCHTHSSSQSNYSMCSKAYGLHSVLQNGELYHLYLVSETEWLSLW